MAATDIPTPARITYVEDFTDETLQIQIQYDTGVGVDDLQLCLSFTGANDDIPYRNIPKKTGFYYIAFTDEERKILRQGITQNNKRTIRVYIRSIINGYTYYSYLTKTITLVNYEPTISPVIVDTNARTLSLTGNSNKLIKYFSTAQITMNAQGHKEAEIVKTSD